MKSNSNNKSCGQPSGLQLPEVPVMDWTTAEIDSAYRSIVSSDAEPDLRVAWMANHTIEPAVRATTAFAKSCDVVLSNVIAPYDQHFQEILDEQSDTHGHSPHILILWLSLRKLAPLLAEGSARLDGEDIRVEVDRVGDTIDQWVAMAKERFSSHIFVCNFPRPPSMRYGIADTSSSTGELAIFGALNRRLSDSYEEDARVTVIDISHAVSQAGSRNSWSPKMYRLAKIEWDGAAVKSISELLSRACRALVVPAKKCVVVDLDNTLWGGVLGEEGVDGVKVGEGDPMSESFTAFQNALLDIKSRGIVLAICSKNNESDVEELFDKRSDMPLREDDFAAKRINWDAKHTNIQAIAEDLDIGLDSMVFIDDSPVECELIRQMLPDVKTVHLPSDPAGYADLVYSMYEFDKIMLTDEDKQKTKLYQQNHARRASKAGSGDLTSYLESLGTKLTISPATEEHSNRVHQLFTKTNQFNVTTIRYTPAEVQTFLQSEGLILDVCRVTDNFGDLGIVGMYLMRFDDGVAGIDSFVLSCRALGRGIEAAICNHLKTRAFDELKVKAITASFIPTAKNKPASTFFADQGFTRLAVNNEGHESYRLDAANSTQVECPGITVIKEELPK